MSHIGHDLALIATDNGTRHPHVFFPEEGGGDPEVNVVLLFEAAIDVAVRRGRWSFGFLARRGKTRATSWSGNPSVLVNERSGRPAILNRAAAAAAASSCPLLFCCLDSLVCVRERERERERERKQYYCLRVCHRVLCCAQRRRASPFSLTLKATSAAVEAAGR